MSLVGREDDRRGSRAPTENGPRARGPLARLALVLFFLGTRVTLVVRKPLGKARRKPGTDFRPRVLAGLLLAACNGEDATRLRGTVSELTVVTFNTALGVGLAEYPEQRFEAIARDLSELGADVICLQEVWQYDDVERMAALLEPTHPYASWSVQPRASSQSGAACLESESSLLLACLRASCQDLPDQEIALCAITNCVDDFSQVSMACQQCVIANQNEQPVDIATTCADEEAEVAAFEEQNGLMILSRLPLADLDFRPMKSSLGDRGLLAARIGRDLGSSLDVLCTHLSPTFSDIPYAGELGSWEGEREHHIDELLRFADERRGAGGSILLGDMNCGPETALARGAGPQAFEKFVDAGYVDPYVESDRPACTFCSGNPLTGLDDGSGEMGVILDHVLLGGAATSLEARARRIFDEEILVQAGDERVETSHSDHYGVLVDLTPGGGSASP